MLVFCKQTKDPRGPLKSIGLRILRRCQNRQRKPRLNRYGFNDVFKAARLRLQHHCNNGVQTWSTTGACARCGCDFCGVGGAIVNCFLNLITGYPSAQANIHTPSCGCGFAHPWRYSLHQLKLHLCKKSINRCMQRPPVGVGLYSTWALQFDFFQMG